jgi:hypothetical protein
MHTLACRYWVFVNEWLSLRVDALSRRSGRLVGVKLVCDMREADPLKQFRFCWLSTMRFGDLCSDLILIEIHIDLVYLANIHVTFSVASSHSGFPTMTVFKCAFCILCMLISHHRQPKFLHSLFSFSCVLPPLVFTARRSSR